MQTFHLLLILNILRQKLFPSDELSSSATSNKSISGLETFIDRARFSAILISHASISSAATAFSSSPLGYRISAILILVIYKWSFHRHCNKAVEGFRYNTALHVHQVKTKNDTTRKIRVPLERRRREKQIERKIERSSCVGASGFFASWRL
jgi:hypothetical protein